MNSKRFAISLSFPEEHRPFVNAVAETLAEFLGKERIFYDKWYEPELVGQDGDLKLKRIYREESDLVVPFFSSYYKKPWCRLEWHAIRAMLVTRREHDTVIPVDIDGTSIEGWEKIDFAIRLQNRSAEEIAELIVDAYGHRFLEHIAEYRLDQPSLGANPTRHEHRIVRVPQFHLTRFVEPKMFVGRADEIRQAKSLLLSNESVLLVGAPRAGKTSFCYKLLDELTKTQTSILGVRINLQFSVERTLSTFLSRTLIAIAGELARGVFGAMYTHLEIDKSRLPPPFDANARFLTLHDCYAAIKRRTHRSSDQVVTPIDLTEFQAFVADLIEVADENDRSKRIIVFDEANHLPVEFSVELLSSLAETFAGHNIACLMAASPLAKESTKLLGESLSHCVQLSPFRGRSEMLELIETYWKEEDAFSGVPIQEDAIDAIWKLTDHSPYQIQWLCWRSFSLANESNSEIVKLEHVEKSIQYLRIHYSHIFSGANND